jgi:tRNA pseudouridine13 synthase
VAQESPSGQEGAGAPALPPWPRAHGAPVAAATVRTSPADFQVEELLGFEPDGAGEHLMVWLEKTSANTVWAGRQLAAFAGLQAREVSHSGLKDRHAVTRQWFSLHLANRQEPDWSRFEADGLRVLHTCRHSRKLRPGTHAANRFAIVLRDVTGPVASHAELVRDHGVPNYFGEQRYGRDGGNLAAAAAMFAGGRRARREQRSMLLSAARSAIFDQLLSWRVARGDWNRLLRGDVAALAGSSSWFTVEEVDASLDARLADFDVHPSGPLWGSGETATAGEVAELELAAAQHYADLRDGLLAAGGSRMARRPLRVRPDAFHWAQDGNVVELSFTLPAGSYATSVLREIADVTDVMR